MSHTSLPFRDSHMASSVVEPKVFWEIAETRIFSPAEPPWSLSNDALETQIADLYAVQSRTFQQPSRDMRQVEPELYAHISLTFIIYIRLYTCIIIICILFIILI